MGRRAERWLAAGGGALALTLLGTGVASAHQPLFIDDTTTAEESPVIEDGTVSFAVYGVIGGTGGRAVVRARFAMGDPLFAELLIPDRRPERSLAVTDRPLLTVVAPDGEETRIGNDGGDRFDEPFSNTSYVRLGSLETAAATAGVYRFEVTGPVPSRFTVAIGREEVPGEVTGGRPVAAADLARWYSTAPAAVEPAATSTPPPTTVAPEPDTPSGESNQNDQGSPVGPALWIGGVVVLALVAAVVVRRRQRLTLGHGHPDGEAQFPLPTGAPPSDE